MGDLGVDPHVVSLDRLVAAAAPFTLTQAEDRGVKESRVRDAARRGTLRRLCRGVYVSARADDSPRLRLLAHQLLLRPGAVFSHLTAAHVLAPHLDLPTPLTVTVPPPDSGPLRSCLHVVRARLEPREQVSAGGVRVTSPVRTLLDAAADDETAALVAVDGVAHLWPWALGEARGAVRAGSRRARQARRVLAAAEPSAESPQETRTRRVLLGHGLPPAVAQYEVVDDAGWFVARVDLAWPRLQLAVEYDGRDSHPLGLARDRERGWRLQRAGWLAVHVTSELLRREEELCARVVEAARMQAGRLRLPGPVEW